MIKIQNGFGISGFVNWSLFEICQLKFEIYLRFVN